MATGSHNALHRISDSIDELSTSPPRSDKFVPEICIKHQTWIPKLFVSSPTGLFLFFDSNKSFEAALFHSHCLLKVGRRKQKKKFHSFAMTSFPLFINLRLSFSFTFFFLSRVCPKKCWWLGHATLLSTDLAKSSPMNVALSSFEQ